MGFRRPTPLQFALLACLAISGCDSHPLDVPATAQGVDAFTSLPGGGYLVIVDNRLLIYDPSIGWRAGAAYERNSDGPASRSALTTDNLANSGINFAPLADSVIVDVVFTSHRGETLDHGAEDTEAPALGLAVTANGWVYRLRWPNGVTAEPTIRRLGAIPEGWEAVAVSGHHRPFSASVLARRTGDYHIHTVGR
ncbi:hypothetical protein J2T57_003297 [Natronocella acetinitrilica]|uniref:Uncharacterized protein n=1 Tax=Natronocella acetinitrilica TaxID=414046 RepID=A0AAE3G817_9GAMM|nr:hypothetical protein [Natronocella acetinitrilica]MCP1676138.1 hypothetical protein [Natronocella acetinitrilica]